MDKNSRKQKDIDQMWYEIQDIIGSAKSWLKWIVDLFFTPNLKHSETTNFYICHIQWAKS